MAFQGITVALAGLMLICLTGDSDDCPLDGGPNTAWVIKAFPDTKDDYTMPCGWYSKGANETTLKIRFSTIDFDYRDIIGTCEKAGRDFPDDVYDCELPGSVELDLGAETPKKNRVYSSEASLLRLSAIDNRYIRPNLQNRMYVPWNIKFPFAEIRAARAFPQDGDTTSPPTLWSSNGPDQQWTQKYSDKLLAKYSSATYVYVNYLGVPIFRFYANKNDVRLTLINEADTLAAVDHNGFQDLAYLLWYYRVGEWRTKDGKCPTYDKQSILLRCRNLGCNYFDDGKRATIFWPVMRGE